MTYKARRSSWITAVVVSSSYVATSVSASPLYMPPPSPSEDDPTACPTTLGIFAQYTMGPTRTEYASTATATVTMDCGEGCNSVVVEKIGGLGPVVFFNTTTTVTDATTTTAYVCGATAPATASATPTPGLGLNNTDLDLDLHLELELDLDIDLGSDPDSDLDIDLGSDSDSDPDSDLYTDFGPTD